MPANRAMVRLDSSCGSWSFLRSKGVLEVRGYLTSGMPGWSAGRGPGAGQKNLRSDSRIGTSLMLASRRRIRPLFVELPQFVAVAAMPAAVGVVPLVLEPHGDPVVGEGPQGLDQPVIEFALPLAGQELADLVAADHELAPVPPHRILGVSEGHTVRVAGVPGVLGRPDLEDTRTVA